MFTTILTATDGSLGLTEAVICLFVSAICGLIIALVYMYQGNYSKNFVTSLVLFPMIVQVVITIVNGNLGTSVAVLGTFSLVKFRSAPGSSREISSIFLAMAVGLATGMGYVIFALSFTVAINLIIAVLGKTNFGEKKNSEKELRITIPENLDYTEIFDDLFDGYTKKATLERVKTTNLGSMYELNYSIILKDMDKEKEFIDQLRCRNGNLTIHCGRPQVVYSEL